MPRAKVVPNGGGILKVLKYPGTEQLIRSKAENVASAARASAPVATGAYRDSIEVEVEQHPTRVVAHVVAKDWKAHILEARLGVLARALDAAR